MGGFNSFSCTLDLKAIPQTRPRVSRNGGVYYSKRLTEYRKTLTLLLKGQSRPHIDYPCSVRIVCSGTQRHPDCDNLAKAILDAMVDAGVLADDNSRIVRKLEVEVLDSRRPLIRIDVTPYVPVILCP